MAQNHTVGGKHRQGETAMPFGKTSEPRERIEANNLVKMPDGTREFEIVDAWLYSVVEETATSERTGHEYTKRKYTEELTNDQDCQFKLRLVKRPDVVISDTLRVYLGKKSKFAKLMESLIGVAPGDELETYLLAGNAELDAKATSKKIRSDLVGKRVLCTTKRNEETWYVRVEGYTAVPSDNDDFGDSVPVPAKSPAPEQAPPRDQFAERRQAHVPPAQAGGEFGDDLDDEIPF